MVHLAPGIEWKVITSKAQQEMGKCRWARKCQDRKAGEDTTKDEEDRKHKFNHAPMRLLLFLSR